VQLHNSSNLVAARKVDEKKVGVQKKQTGAVQMKKESRVESERRRHEKLEQIRQHEKNYKKQLLAVKPKVNKTRLSGAFLAAAVGKQDNKPTSVSGVTSSPVKGNVFTGLDVNEGCEATVSPDAAETAVDVSTKFVQQESGSSNRDSNSEVVRHKKTKADRDKQRKHDIVNLRRFLAQQRAELQSQHTQESQSRHMAPKASHQDIGSPALPSPAVSPFTSFSPKSDCRSLTATNSNAVDLSVGPPSGIQEYSIQTDTNEVKEDTTPNFKNGGEFSSSLPVSFPSASAQPAGPTPPSSLTLPKDSDKNRLLFLRLKEQADTTEKLCTEILGKEKFDAVYRYVKSLGVEWSQFEANIDERVIRQLIPTSDQISCLRHVFRLVHCQSLIPQDLQ